MSKQESHTKTVQKRKSSNSVNVLEKIQKCQREIIGLRTKCDRDINEIEKRYIKAVKPYTKDRNFFILQIPQFWSTVLLHHPLLSSIFEPGEKDVIKYITSLDIEDDSSNPDFFKIHFLFCPNPYFENRVLVKQFTEEGSASTTIKWRTNQVFPQAINHEVWEHDELGMEKKGFFRWFSDPEEQFCDPIADIFRCQVWFDPLEYYFFETEPVKTKEKQQQVSSTLRN